MKICFLCDLHLGYNKTAVQYEAFDYALADIRRKQPELVVCAGDITSDGNVFAANGHCQNLRAQTSAFAGRAHVVAHQSLDFRLHKRRERVL